MTVAMSSTNSARQVRPRKPDIATGSNKITPITQRKLTNITSLSGSQSVKFMPAPSSPPMWLDSLVGVQRSSTVLTLVLVAACLSVYGWTVYCQQMWGKESRKLENLRRQEQQLTVANAVMKHQIAKQAELPGTELVPPDPSQIIFLEPAAPRSVPAIQRVPDRDSAASESDAARTPLGY